MREYKWLLIVGKFKTQQQQQQQQLLLPLLRLVRYLSAT
jgi:hypothetical protein